MTLDEAYDKLRWAFDLLEKRDSEKKDFIAKSSSGQVDEQLDFYEQSVAVARAQVYGYLHRLVAYPPHHHRHAPKLPAFQSTLTAPPERTVFVMTKYPEQDPAKQTDDDVKLARVIEVVMNSIAGMKTGRGEPYVPCIASTNEFVPDLWENVELHLLGSGLGVAIVEDKCRPELNPNVAFEWGWMRGMGKRVLYLGEQTFDHQRADWGGLIQYRFEWNNPEDTIPGYVKKWLTTQGTP